MLNYGWQWFQAHLWAQELATILGLFVVAWLVRVVFIGQLRRLAKRTASTLDDALINLVDKAITPLLLLAVAATGVNLVTMPQRWSRLANRGLSAIGLIIGLYYTSRAVQLLLSRWLEKREVQASVREPVRFITHLLFAGLGVMIVLENLGISLTAVWTTVGVGSVAVGLALQDTLANFFAGIYLRIDRPIREGDYVKIDSKDEGFVVLIGWRSTRIRTLPNNIVVVPNSKLASATVTNYSLPEPGMSLLVSISVSYGEDPDQVEKILVEEAKAAAANVEGLRKDPAPFVRFIPGFGDSSLDFTLICRVATYVDQYLAQHELRKRILARFRQEGISIPFPQRDVHLFSHLDRTAEEGAGNGHGRARQGKELAQSAAAGDPGPLD